MINKVILIGNVGADPEIRVTQSGSQLAKFGLATSESYKDKEGIRQTKTEWHNIVIYSDSLVNVVKSYVKKGSKLYIEGSIHTRKWSDSSNIERYTTEIILQGYNAVIKLLDSRDISQHNIDKGNAFVQEEIEDEIPF